jgi:integrase
MPQTTITDRFAASSPAPGNYFDTTIKGLALRVTAAGGKTWSFVYRVQGLGPQWLKLGTYPATSLIEARAKAKVLRRAVDDKRDPIAEQKAAEAAASAPPTPVAPVLTVRTFAKTFVTFQKGRKKTWQQDERKIEKYLLPVWGDLAVADITRKMVAGRLSEIAATGITIGVNRVQTVIGRLFAVAMSQGHIDSNPAARMDKLFKEKARTRVLTEDEIRALYAALQYRPSEAADVIWLRLVLGQRGEETAGMLWREIDLDKRTWFLDDARTKNGRPHLLWLPDMAIAILRRRRKSVTKQTEPRVFPALKDFHCGSRTERELYEVAKTFEHFDWRDLRRTFSTGLGDLGIDDGVIDRLLNHAAATVGRRHYNHAKYLPEKQVALAAWDRELTRILKNKPKTSRVLQMPTR